MRKRESTIQSRPPCGLQLLVLSCALASLASSRRESDQYPPDKGKDGVATREGCPEQRSGFGRVNQLRRGGLRGWRARRGSRRRAGGRLTWRRGRLFESQVGAAEGG